MINLGRDATMSPTKLNSLLTGAFFAIIIALGSSVVAQDYRLFKPYTAETFGGGRRGNDGVYGSVSGIYWSFSTPDGGYIGATNAKGDEETRWVVDPNSRVYQQTNSVKIEMVEPMTTLGTRFEVGNRRGHHGWLVSGYGLPNQTQRMNVQNITMTIRDEGNLTYDVHDLTMAINQRWGAAENIFLWNRSTDSIDYSKPIDVTRPFSVGYLWGYYQSVDRSLGVFAPLPIWFKDVAISTSASHRSAELMYTYRPHPFTWGSMELLGGARYWNFEDKFGFFGTGPAGPDAGEEGNNTGYYGPISVLSDMIIDAEGNNCIVGPQFGLKLNRHNARWTFGAEGKFTAGINAQTVKTQGYIATNFDYTENYNYQWENIGWMPVGLQYNNTNFGHKETKTYFSPILEGRLSAEWQWTNAVSFFGAVNGMFADNIARGVRVTDYVVKSDGTIFGIRGDDRNTCVFVYGVELGLKVSR